MKKQVNKAVSVILIVLLLVTAVPLDGLVGLRFLSVAAKAESEVAITTANEDDAAETLLEQDDVEKSLDDLKKKLQEKGNKAVAEHLAFIQQIAQKSIATTAAKKAQRRASAAEDTTTWSFDAATGVLTISGAGAMPDLVPDFLEDEEITGSDIASIFPWGEYLMSITSVVVEEGITRIGDFSFAYHMNVKTISLPSTLQSIGNGAFGVCSSLETLEISPDVMEIGEDAFVMCMNLQTLVLPDSLQTFDGNLEGCLFLKQLTIPATVTEVSVEAPLLETVYNKSLTAVVERTDGGSEKNLFLECAYQRAYMLTYLQGQEPTEEMIMAEILSAFNERFGTNYQTIEELYPELYSEESPVNSLLVYCYDASAQHDYCARQYISHILFDTTEPHTTCFVMSGTSTDDYDNAFSWSVNVETRVLTISGSGSMCFSEKAISEERTDEDGNTYTSTHYESNYPRWYYISDYYDDVVFSEGIQSISGSNNFQKLNSITLPASLEACSPYVFNNTRIQSITVAEGNNVFLSIDGVLYRRLNEAEISEIQNVYGVASFGDLALFYYPEGKQTFRISERTIAMDDSSLYNSAISSMTIPNHVIVLGNDLFGYNYTLQTLTLGDSVAVFDGWVVRSCTALSNIQVSENNTRFVSVDGVVFSKDLTALIAYPAGKAEPEYTLPASTSVVQSYAFSSYVEYLKAVIIINPNCTISYNSIPTYLTIHGEDGSTAQTYAENNGNTFVVIETKEIQSITINTLPDKTEFMQGKSLNTNGLTLLVTYTDGTTAIRTGGFTTSGYDSSVLGVCAVTVTYAGFTVSFDVTIIERTDYVLYENEPLTVEVDAVERTEYIKFIPSETTDYRLSVSGDGSYSLYLCDAQKNELQYCFSGSSYTLTGGETYYYHISTWSSSTSTFTLTIEKYHIHYYVPSTTQEATCTQAGIITYSCSCGDSYTEEIDMLLHEDENEDYVCDNCGQEIGLLDEGTCGESVTWKLYDNGILKLEGTGEMESYDYAGAVPWYSCRNQIQKVRMADGIMSVSNYAFYGCNELTEVTLSSTLTCIQNDAFLYCYDLDSIDIPVSVTTIGNCAFEYCSSLSSITIPAVTTSIGVGAFDNCHALTTIDVDSENTTFTSENGILYNKAKTILMKSPAGAETAVIPNTVEEIMDSAFAKCWKISEIQLPNSVKRIGSSAFYDCEQLVSINLPESLEFLGSTAFYSCDTLQSIRIPKKLESIPYGAFRYCGSLETVTFAQDSILKEIEQFAFQNCKISTIDLPDAVRTIGISAFESCSCLTSISIPEQIYSIGRYAFDYTALYYDTNNWDQGALYIDRCLIKTNSDLPNSYMVKADTRFICEGAFADRFSLENLTLPFVGNRVNSAMDDNQFPFGYIFDRNSNGNCQEIYQEFIYNAANGSMAGRYAYIPNSLKKVTVTGGIIMQGAFDGCQSLDLTIVLEAGVTQICRRAIEAKTVKIYGENTTIHNAYDTIYGTIYGYEGSTAHAYALKHGKTFYAFGSQEEPQEQKKIADVSSTVDLPKETYGAQDANVFASDLFASEVDVVYDDNTESKFTVMSLYLHYGFNFTDVGSDYFSIGQHTIHLSDGIHTIAISYEVTESEPEPIITDLSLNTPYTLQGAEESYTFTPEATGTYYIYNGSGYVSLYTEKVNENMTWEERNAKYLSANWKGDSNSVDDPYRAEIVLEAGHEYGVWVSYSATLMITDHELDTTNATVVRITDCRESINPKTTATYEYGYSVEFTDYNINNHHFTETIIRASTETEIGILKRTCEVCGQVEYQAIDAHCQGAIGVFETFKANDDNEVVVYYTPSESGTYQLLKRNDPNGYVYVRVYELDTNNYIESGSGALSMTLDADVTYKVEMSFSSSSNMSSVTVVLCNHPDQDEDGVCDLCEMRSYYIGTIGAYETFDAEGLDNSYIHIHYTTREAGTYRFFLDLGNSKYVRVYKDEQSIASSYTSFNNPLNVTLEAETTYDFRIDRWNLNVETISTLLCLPCIDHAFGTWEIVKDSTCEDLGLKQRTCSVCGFIERADIAIHHDTDEDGVCDVCGARMYYVLPNNGEIEISFDQGSYATLKFTAPETSVYTFTAVDASDYDPWIYYTSTRQKNSPYQMVLQAGETVLLYAGYYSSTTGTYEAGTYKVRAQIEKSAVIEPDGEIVLEKDSGYQYVVALPSEANVYRFYFPGNTSGYEFKKVFNRVGTMVVSNDFDRALYLEKKAYAAELNSYAEDITMRIEALVAEPLEEGASATVSFDAASCYQKAYFEITPQESGFYRAYASNVTNGTPTLELLNNKAYPYRFSDGFSSSYYAYQNSNPATYYAVTGYDIVFVLEAGKTYFLSTWDTKAAFSVNYENFVPTELQDGEDVTVATAESQISAYYAFTPTDDDNYTISVSDSGGKANAFRVFVANDNNTHFAWLNNNSWWYLYKSAQLFTRQTVIALKKDTTYYIEALGNASPYMLQVSSKNYVTIYDGDTKAVQGKGYFKFTPEADGLYRYFATNNSANPTVAVHTMTQSNLNPFYMQGYDRVYRMEEGKTYYIEVSVTKADMTLQSVTDTISCGETKNVQPINKNLSAYYLFTAEETGLYRATSFTNRNERLRVLNTSDGNSGHGYYHAKTYYNSTNRYYPYNDNYTFTYGDYTDATVFGGTPSQWVGFDVPLFLEKDKTYLLICSNPDYGYSFNLIFDTLNAETISDIGTYSIATTKTGEHKYFIFCPEETAPYQFKTASQGSLMCYLRDETLKNGYKVSEGFNTSFVFEAGKEYVLEIENKNTGSINQTMYVTKLTATPIAEESIAQVNIENPGDFQYFLFTPQVGGNFDFYGSLGDAVECSYAFNGDGSVYKSDRRQANWMHASFAAGNTYLLETALLNKTATNDYTVQFNHHHEPIAITKDSGAVTLFNHIDTHTNPEPLSSSDRSYWFDEESVYNYCTQDVYNGIYDIQVVYYTDGSSVQLGNSFTVNGTPADSALLNIYAYDVDEENGERALVYLVDETANVRTQLNGYLTGTNQKWSTSTFDGISKSLFTLGHTYHFELKESVDGWKAYIRNVSISLPLDDTEPVVSEIKNHEVSATIQENGEVEVTLYLETDREYTFEIEYTANKDGEMKASHDSTFTVRGAGETSVVRFGLDVGSTRGEYTIYVIVKDEDKNVITTYQTVANYDYRTVHYVSAYGGDVPKDNNQYKSGDSVEVLFDIIPACDDYTFLGWARTDTAAEPEFTSDGGTSFTMGDDDVVLYAVWKSNACEHIWDTGELTIVPTCKEEGVRSYTCSACGAIKTEAVEIDPTNHADYGTEIKNSKAATCKEDGYTGNTVCKGCGAVFETGETISKDTVTHAWNEGEIAAAATCKEEGIKTFSCTVCGTTKTEVVEINPTNHVGYGTETRGYVAAQCETEGYTGDTYCLGCGNKIGNGAVIEPLGHDFDTEWTVDLEPTCTAVGSKSHHCTRCDEKSHVTEIDKLDHTWNEGAITKEPTATEPGIKTYTCIYCDESMTEEIPKLDEEIQAGDINGDGKVNNKDLTRLMKYLSGEDVSVEASALDVNGDGQVNNKDLTRLMKYLSGEDVEIFIS